MKGMGNVTQLVILEEEVVRYHTAILVSKLFT